MPILVLYALQVLCFLAAIAYGFRAARNDPELRMENALHRSMVLVAVLCVGLVVFAVALAADFSDVVCQVLPLVVQRYVTWLTWGVFCTFFAAVAGYAWSLSHARKKERSWRLLGALVVLNVVLAVFAFRYLDPIADKLGPAITENGMVMQSTDATCVAACLANVARHFDITLDEREAAKLLLTSHEGTSRGQLRYALADLGLTYKTVSADALSEVTPPAVLFVDHSSVGREGHAVVYMRRVASEYEIWDPITGLELWNEDRSHKTWHGNAIECGQR